MPIDFVDPIRKASGKAGLGIGILLRWHESTHITVLEYITAIFLRKRLLTYFLDVHHPIFRVVEPLRGAPILA